MTALPLAYASLKKNQQFGINLTLVTFFVLILLYKGLLASLATDAQSPWLTFLLTLPGFGLLEIYGASVVLGMGCLYFVYYIGFAWALSWGAKQSWSVERLYLVLTGLPLLLCGGILFIFSVFYGFDVFFIETKKYLLYIQEKLITLDQSSGLSKEELLFLREFGQQMVHRIMTLLPVIIVNMTLFIAWCNMFVARRWIRGVLAYKSLGDLTRWQLKDQWVWALIGSSALFFLNVYLLKISTVTILLSNVLLFVLFVYFFQGLSIVSYYLQKRNQCW